MSYFGLLRRNFIPWTLVLSLLLCLPHFASAQASSASLSVTVSDTSGAVIPNASETLRNSDTNQQQTSVSNKSGNVTFSFLKPGHYALTVIKDGFSDVSVNSILLNVGDDKHLQLVLKVGSATQSVTVDGRALNINTTNGSVSTIIDRQFVENMPLNGRSFQDLIELTPGVVTNSPQSGGQSGYDGEFSVNGQRTESNVYTVDGVNANTGGYIYGYGTAGTSGNLPAATALGTTQSLVSVDALQEFRVSSSSYSAEYGLSPGGQFSFATRSGTNALHGTAFDYLRNNYFDANDWFNDQLGLAPTSERQNDFGGTIGGPVRIPRVYDGGTRSFFFFSYEGLRLTQPTAGIVQYVPTLSLRQAAAPALQPVLNAFPKPTGSEATVPCDGVIYTCPAGQPVNTPVPSGLASFAKNYSLPNSIDSTSIRFDQQINTKYKMFYRFGDTPSATQTRTLSMLGSNRQSSVTHTFGLTTTFTQTIVNDFRLNYTSSTGSNQEILDDFGGAQPANLFQLQGLAGPNANAEVLIEPPGFGVDLLQAQSTQPQHAWNIVEGLTIATGKHTIKAGLQFRELASRLQQATPEPYSFFNSAQSLITNDSFASGVYVYARSYPKYTTTGLYLQDAFQLDRRLSLSYGLRWEVNPPPTQTSGTLPYVVQGNLSDPANLALAPENTRFWKTTYLNFAPRLGIAYQAHQQPGHETVLRAGGGVFLDSGGQNSVKVFGNAPGQGAHAFYSNVSYPLTPVQVNLPITNPPVAPYNAIGYYFPSHLQLPYTLQWNASVEQALGKYQTITISYVGSSGRRLLYEQYDIPTTGPFSDDGFYVEGTGTTSNYDALQVKFQRSLSHGLQVMASYNWAHAIDFGSQDLAYTPERANADFDVRHNLNVAAIYDIPRVATTRLLNPVINHWSLDSRFVARTAFPITLQGNYITYQSYNGYSSLNTVPGVPVYLSVPGIPGNREINPAAFSLPLGNDFGDAPRNALRGFDEIQLDAAVRRTFPIRERLNLQFRAEAFNLLNHPNFGNINPLYGDPQFGQATQMLNESIGNLSPLYQQGGPRSMQFALKIQF